MRVHGIPPDPFYDVEVGPAQTRCSNPDNYFVGSVDGRLRNILEFELDVHILVVFIQDRSSHTLSLNLPMKIPDVRWPFEVVLGDFEDSRSVFRLTHFSIYYPILWSI